MAETPDVPAEDEDDLRRRFREALQRKHGSDSAPHRAQHGKGKGPEPSSNEKRQRQFRRKSGG
jgi:hypothetical protein